MWKYTPREFFELADRLKPRLYSIASSHDAHPGFVELTVGIVRFEYNGRARGGLCTQFMADEINTSANWRIYVANKIIHFARR